MASGDVKDIHIMSGVNSKLEGFCTVSINHGEMLGQLDPETVRTMALGWLEAAEGAETDAIVFRMLRESGVPDSQAGMFIAGMREKRGKRD